MLTPYAPDVDVEDLVDEPRCRVCGCTSSQQCPGGCVWAAEDLCSRCARTEAPQLFSEPEDLVDLDELEAEAAGELP